MLINYLREFSTKVLRRRRWWWKSCRAYRYSSGLKVRCWPAWCPRNPSTAWIPWAEGHPRHRNRRPGAHRGGWWWPSPMALSSVEPSAPWRRVRRRRSWAGLRRQTRSSGRVLRCPVEEVVPLRWGRWRRICAGSPAAACRTGPGGLLTYWYKKPWEAAMETSRETEGNVWWWLNWVLDLFILPIKQASWKTWARAAIYGCKIIIQFKSFS